MAVQQLTMKALKPSLSLQQSKRLQQRQPVKPCAVARPQQNKPLSPVPLSSAPMTADVRNLAPAKRTDAVVASAQSQQGMEDPAVIGWDELWSLRKYLPTVGWITLGATVAASIGILINDYSTPFCFEVPGGCEEIPLFMKVPLIATHLLTFALIPTAMYVFYTRAPQLSAWGASDPFVAIVGVSYIMASIAGEIGWHVTQKWFYQEEYAIMNYVFYFFLCTGTSLWAYGIELKEAKEFEVNKYINYALLACGPASALFYYLCASNHIAKIPIYILLSFEYAVLTWRFYKLLNKDPKVFLFPFFSVGVNLFFIAQLNSHKGDPILNPLFHILHDAAGTELGVLLITALVWVSPAAALPQATKTRK